MSATLEWEVRFILRNCLLDISTKLLISRNLFLLCVATELQKQKPTDLE